MSETVLNTDALPPPIRKRFRTPRVSIQNLDEGVIILPLSEISELRGIAKGSSFTTDKLREYRGEERALENVRFAE